jgi:hypothetical protein
LQIPFFDFRLVIFLKHQQDLQMESSSNLMQEKTDLAAEPPSVQIFLLTILRQVQAGLA